MAKNKKLDISKAFAQAKKKKQETIQENLVKAQKEALQKKIEEEKRKEEERQRLEAQKAEEEKLRAKQLKEERERLEKELIKNELKTFKINITTLSPIHIGDGTEYEPINYVVKENYLYTFDEQFVLEKIYEHDKKLPTDDKLLDIYLLVAFLRSKADFIIENKLYKNKIEIAKDIADLYKSDFGTSRNNDESINQMLINKHVSTINPYTKKLEPYIPGSSIKGSLQTVLNLSVQDSKKLKISDTIGKNVKNQIAWSIRVGGKSDIPQKLEIISSNSSFECEISKKNSLDFKDIMSSLHSFYEKADSQLFNRYKASIKKNETQFLLRVGRYCGKNFIVRELSEMPKTKSLFRKKEKDVKTELPFGWLLCEIL